MKPRTKYILITISLFIIELLIATVFSGIEFLRSYIGDLLVVILLYFGVKIFWEGKPLTLAVLVFGFAGVVEVLQFFQPADALGLQPGSLLSILIGTRFSWMDILMYGLGCAAAYWLETGMINKPDFMKK